MSGGETRAMRVARQAAEFRATARCLHDHGPLNDDFSCEECIRLGYALRLTPVRIGRETRLAITMPKEAPHGR